MINNKFELYKVKRELRRSGKYFDFYRYGVNDFKEPDDVPKKIHTLRGLYHEHTAHQLDTYIFFTAQEAALHRNKKFRQILCLTEDITFLDENKNEDILSIGDFVMFNGHLAKLTGLRDVMEWNMITDISFEEVDYGTSSGVSR